MEGVDWLGDVVGGGAGNGVDLNAAGAIGAVWSDVDCGGNDAHLGGLPHPGYCSLGSPGHSGLSGLLPQGLDVLDWHCLACPS